MIGGALGSLSAAALMVAQPQLDTIEFADGSVRAGHVHAVAEGAYVTVDFDDGRVSVPWEQVRAVELARAEGKSIRLEFEINGFEADAERTEQTPYIEMVTTNASPIALVRLRTTSGPRRLRLASGYEEVCRSPCNRVIDAGSRSFFVDLDPWTASKIFELPDEADTIQLRVRPGNARLRKAGFATMVSGGAVALAGFVALGFWRGGNLTWLGVNATALTLSGMAIPIGAVLYARGRAKVDIVSAAP